MPSLPPTHSPRINAPVHKPPIKNDNRIRGGKLMRIRERIFKKQPLCVLCLAMNPQRVSKSVVVDHIVPLHLGGMDTDDNRQGLCHDCHAEKTSQEARYRASNPDYRKKKPSLPEYSVV